MANIKTRDTDNGRRYDVRFMVNGKHKTKSFRKKGDADSYRKTVEANELAGLVSDPKGGEVLFGPFAENWIETRMVKGKPLSAATQQGYRGLMRRHLTPAFGGTKLRQITKERVRSWHNKLSAAQPDQAAKAYRLLRAILMTAAQDDLIPLNPCVIKGAGTENPSERPMLDTEVVVQLADAIEPRLRLLVLIAGFRTLRPGELLGLQRQDVDLLHRTIRVERQTQEVTGGWVVVPNAKSEAGKRVLTLPAPIADELAEHLDLYVAPEPDAWLFTRPSGRPLRRQDLSHAWSDACKTVGISGVRLYDLRHHAATVSARDPNVTLKELMAMMGHSSMRER